MDHRTFNAVLAGAAATSLLGRLCASKMLHWAANFNGGPDS